MKNKIAIYFTTLFLVIISCNRNNPVQQTDSLIPLKNHTTIKVNPHNNPLGLSEVIKSVRFITLKTPKESIIGDLGSIAYDRGHYFCSEQNSNGKINSYDEDGNFIVQYSRRGKGPGEYLYISAFALNKDSKELWIQDNIQRILKYDYKGNFLGSMAMDRLSMSGWLLHDHTWICYTAKSVNHMPDNPNDYFGFELTLINNEQEGHIRRYIPVNKELFPVNQSHTTVTEPTPFSELEHSFTFHHTVSNMIYSIDKQTKAVNVKYLIDFGSKEYQQDIAQMPTSEMIKYINTHPDRAGLVKNVIETNNFLWFQFRIGADQNYAVYDKKNKKIKSGAQFNDLFDAPVRFLSNRGNILIGCVDCQGELTMKEKIHEFLSPNELEQLKKTDMNSDLLLIEIELKQQER